MSYFAKWFDKNKDDVGNISRVDLAEKAFYAGVASEKASIEPLRREIKRMADEGFYVKNKHSYDFFCGIIWAYNVVCPSDQKINEIPEEPEMWVDDINKSFERVNND